MYLFHSHVASTPHLHLRVFYTLCLLCLGRRPSVSVPLGAQHRRLLHLRQQFQHLQGLTLQDQGCQQGRQPSQDSQLGRRSSHHLLGCRLSRSLGCCRYRVSNSSQIHPLFTEVLALALFSA